AFGERKNDLLALAADVLGVPLALVLVLFSAAQIRLVGLDNLALAAERAARRCRHGFSDTMRKEPSGFVGHAKHTLQLKRTDTLLARAHQMHGQEPFRQRYLAALHDGSHGDRELPVAGGAIV